MRGGTEGDLKIRIQGRTQSLHMPCSRGCEGEVPKYLAPKRDFWD